MATTARLDLTVWRNDDAYEFRLRIRGPNLTNVDMKAQIRLEGDTPGPPLVNLATTSNGNAEGIRLAGVSVIDGATVNDVRIRLNKSTRQALPYGGELGEAAKLGWGLLIDGRTRIEGGVYLPAQVYGSDNAPANRPVPHGVASTSFPTAGADLAIAGDDVTVLAIEGIDLLEPLVGSANSAAERAEAAAQVLQPIADVLSVSAADGYAAVVRDEAGYVVEATRLDGTKEIGRLIVHELIVESGGMGGTDLDTLLPSDPRLTYDGHTRTVSRGGAAVVVARPANAQGDAQQYQVPSARKAYETNAAAITETVILKGTIEGVATPAAGGPFVVSLLIDGVEHDSASSNAAGPGDTVLTLSATGLGDELKRVDVLSAILRASAFGVTRVSRGAGVGPVAKHGKLLVTAGTSITCGQNASRTSATWAFGLARDLGMDWIDTGYPSRQAQGPDGARDGALGGKLTTYDPFTNDFLIGQGQGRTLIQSGDQLSAYLTGFFTQNTSGHLFVISPFPNAIAGANPTYTIAQYRTEASARVNAFQAANPGVAARLHYVDGSTLTTINHLDDGTHPSDVGHADIRAALAIVLAPYA